MRDERVRSCGLHHDVKRGGTAGPHHVRLHALQIVGRIAAFVHVVPDLTDRVERGELVRSGVDEIDPDAFTRFGIEFPPAGHKGVILEDAAVEHHTVVLSIEHGLDIVRVLKKLRLHQHIFTIRLGPDLRIFRIDDDGAEHPARDMLDHGRGTAVVEEHPRLLRRE